MESMLALVTTARTVMFRPWFRRRPMQLHFPERFAPSPLTRGCARQTVQRGLGSAAERKPTPLRNFEEMTVKLFWPETTRPDVAFLINYALPRLNDGGVRCRGSTMVPFLSPVKRICVFPPFTRPSRPTSCLHSGASMGKPWVCRSCTGVKHLLGMIILSKTSS